MSIIRTINRLLNSLQTGKQDVLVSGTNIKTVNSNSLLGSGDVVISSGDSGGGAYSETVSFTATGVPTGTEEKVYWWTEAGNMVTFMFSFYYSTPANNASFIFIPFPADVPPPHEPVGFTTTNDYMYAGTGNTATSAASVGTQGRVLVRKVTGGHLAMMTFGGTNARVFYGSVTYKKA